MNESHTFPSVDSESSGNLFANLTHGYVPLWTQILYFTYIGLIFLSGIPGNLFIITVYIRTKPKKSCDWFILFIGFTDFIVCLVSPVLSVHMELGIKMPYIDGLMCGFEHLWQLTALTSSCFILTFMSIERYIKVCHPMRKSFSPPTSRNISIMCIILAFVFSTYPSIGQFQKETCGHMDNESGMPLEQLYIYFSIYLLCFITVAFAYGRVILTIEEKIKVKQRLIQNSGLYDSRPDSKKELKGENASKLNNWKEKNGIAVDEPSDKNDSGFNQIEETHLIQHEVCEAEDKTMREAVPSLSNKDSITILKGDDKSVPVIYLTEVSTEHSPESVSDAQRLQTNTDSDEEVINSKDGDVINITVNPFFSNSMEFDHSESDVDLIESTLQSPEHNVKENGERSLSVKAQINAPHVLTETNTDHLNDGLIASPKKPDQHSLTDTTKRSTSEMSHLATSVDCDNVEEDLYSDIVQPVAFFQKAKKAMCEKMSSSKKKRSENSRRKRWLRERRVTIMLVSITAVFLGSWIPPWVFYLLAAHGILIFPPGVVTRIMYRHFDKIFLLNYVSNFPIYYRYNTTFRMKAKAVIPKWVRKYYMTVCWCFHNLDNDNDNDNNPGSNEVARA